MNTHRLDDIPVQRLDCEDVTSPTVQGDSVPAQKDHQLFITVGEVKRLLAMDLNTKQIRARHPDIKPSAIAFARAWMIAHNPEEYDRIAGQSAGDFWILLDECMTPRISPAIRNGYKHITHVNFKGLNKTPDSKIWEWLVNHEYDAIVTRDWAQNDENEDLTAIAVAYTKRMLANVRDPYEINMDELPLVIHVRAENQGYKYASKLMRDNEQEILSHLHTRTTPYITVGEGGVKAGPSFSKLWRVVHHTEYDHQQRHDYKQSLIDHWYNAIVNNNDVKCPDEKDRVLYTVKAAVKHALIEKSHTQAASKDHVLANVKADIEQTLVDRDRSPRRTQRGMAMMSRDGYLPG